MQTYICIFMRVCLVAIIIFLVPNNAMNYSSNMDEQVGKEENVMNK